MFLSIFVQLESTHRENIEKLSARLQASEQSLETSKSQCDSLKSVNETETKQLKQEVNTLTCKVPTLNSK